MRVIDDAIFEVRCKIKGKDHSIKLIIAMKRDSKELA